MSLTSRLPSHASVPIANTYRGFVTIEPNGTIYLDSFRPERESAEVHCCANACGVGGRYPDMADCERAGYRIAAVTIDLTLIETHQDRQNVLGEAT